MQSYAGSVTGSMTGSCYFEDQQTPTTFGNTSRFAVSKSPRPGPTDYEPNHDISFKLPEKYGPIPYTPLDLHIVITVTRARSFTMCKLASSE